MEERTKKEERMKETSLQYPAALICSGMKLLEVELMYIMPCIFWKRVEGIVLKANGDLLNYYYFKLDFPSLPSTIVSWHC